MSVKPRDIRIDSLKGLAILLVVLGHAVQYSGGDFDQNLLFRFIYSFHMPLFMFVSGYVAWMVGTGKKPFLKAKFFALVVPFICWYLISYLVLPHGGASFLQYWKNLALSPDHGLWFLWVLFLNFCVLGLSLRTLPKLGVAIFPLLLLIVELLPYSQLGIGLLKWHLPFFLAGYLIPKYDDVLKRFSVLLPISWVAFLPLALTWHRLVLPHHLVALMGALQQHWFSAPFATYIEIAYRYSVPMAGISVCFALIYNFSPVAINKGLAWFGERSLGIYATQFYFLGLGIGTGAILLLTKIIAALTLSIGALEVLKLIPITKIFLLGIFPKNPWLVKAQAKVS